MGLGMEKVAIKIRGMFSSLERATVFLLLTGVLLADWGTLRGAVDRKGFVKGELRPPFHLLWVRHFEGEKISSCVEPIIGEGKLFIGTQNGNLYALDAQNGEPLWRFKANGAFLHSPAFSSGLTVAGSTDGYIYALDCKNGKLKWSFFVGRGGFSSSPLIAEDKVFIGSRNGKFIALELQSGKLLWSFNCAAPIRQTASFWNGRVFFVAEDMRVRCLEAEKGKMLWESEPLTGQTARDYFPIIAEANGRAFVIIRTNPVLNMARLIAQDRHLICENAGIDDSDWRKLDDWIKSEKAMGNPELWEKEQELIVRYLDSHPEARSFFIFDAESGKQMPFPPILWTGGCQGIGNMPVALNDGRLIVLYRSAYGNWNLGVAPLVSLGILDIFKNRITPLFHTNGIQPPWNTFWGTADESQNFLLVGETLLIIHQGTISGFDFNSRNLFPIWGERDSWGGFRNLPWARNEWHGPARGGIAVVGNRIYWQVGSRIICLEMGAGREPARDLGIEEQSVPITSSSPKVDFFSVSELKKLLNSVVEELLSQRWKPLYVEPGLAGREFFFSHSGEVFEALSLAYPHLSENLKRKVREFLNKEWWEHPPYSPACRYDLKGGMGREWYPIPPHLRENGVEIPHPFGNIYSIYLYAERCGEWEKVKEGWEEIKECFRAFEESGWRMEEGKGDLFANKYLSSLIALERMAEKIGDVSIREEAREKLEEIKKVYIDWWRRCGENIKLPIFSGIAEWDKFIGEGDLLFFSIRPHKAKIALFHNLTPDVSAIVKEEASDSIDKVWQTFELLCPTWHLVGEERQVHYGENYIDPPDFSLDAFKAFAWLRKADLQELIPRIDIPFCSADLYFITKIAIVSDLAQ